MASHELIQFVQLWVFDGPTRWLHGFRKVAQDLRVDRIGLRQFAHGAGKVSDLMRVYDGHWQLSLAQLKSQFMLIAVVLRNYLS